jgi:hypothetical protein
MYFSAAASSENDHGSMNLASKMASLPCTRPSSVAPIQRSTGCRILLNVADYLCGIPAAIELLGGKPELDNKVAGQVLRLDLATLFSPEPDQGRLIIAHDNPGIGA